MEWRGYTHNLSEALTKHLGIIIPIVVGMGARVKFVEALASAVPVVSTSLGAEGYDVSTSLFLERNDSRGFTDACVAVLSDAAKYSEMGVRARHHAMSALSWRQSAEGLIDCLHGLTASP
jgi:glycosyltransferase involved in cell wall biosynthesis